VEQVSWAFTKTDAMKPFRERLSLKSVFVLSQELQEAFKKLRTMIVNSVKNGVRTFDLGRQTCLNTDWSKTGISFIKV
jgi:hypothetical protein